MESRRPLVSDRVRERVLDMAQEHNVEVKSVKTGLTHDMTRLVRAAAQQRGLSLSSYLRRAVVAMAAHDMGVPWELAMADEPPVAPYGASGRFTGQILAGQGYGRWKIGRLS